MSEPKILFKSCGEGEPYLTWESDYEDTFVPKSYHIWFSPWCRLFIVERNDGAFFYLKCLKTLNELTIEETNYIRNKLKLQPWMPVTYESMLQIPGDKFVKQVYFNDYPTFLD